ncbi:futalosine hydrolase [Texcoconibacillus texcoconensis]|uniref:Futalosine hydrolase n=1 Tax=Texcoconibacillus texcoconensis TaxID=1095777 RepID=A0A840QSE4_9BACI|nr:futalosine hydrolase [Texcoconibacillus texcoconensis]MBB5174284.1 futalosine hydrolase [Texcoconibacillus texcoconensis]
MSEETSKLSKILIVVSVEAEKEAIQKGLANDQRFDVIVSGVGPTAAAARTATALVGEDYELVINAGIAGGFVGRAEVGSLVLATSSIAADLGAESEESFKPLEELGLGSTIIHTEFGYNVPVVQALQTKNVPVYQGSVLTSSTVTGTRQTAEYLSKRIPYATAEAMEGFGVATAAEQMNIPYMEVRAISNPVGPRNRDAWKIEEALSALTVASSTLSEVL